MQLSIKRLRWILLAAAVLLVAVVSTFIAYGRYRAMQVYSDLIKRSGATLSRDTNGFTYSQTEKGRTVFTLHATKATQVADGKWSLQDVVVTLYGNTGDRIDHIYGHEFAYDEKQGLVRAIGEVHMDLQAPQSLTNVGRAPIAGDNLVPLSALHKSASGEGEDVVHVRTSSVVYIRALGVAATEQKVEFHYGGIDCTALGAEFNSSQSTLRLLANVVADGQLHGSPVHITAVRADVDRTSNIAILERPVLVSPAHDGSVEHTARADSAVLDLRPDGSISAARAKGNVTLSGGLQQVTATQLDASFTPQTIPEKARLSGGVRLVDADPLRPTSASADATDIDFDSTGAPTRLVANGSGSLATANVVDKRQLPRGLARNLQGNRITALFVPAPGRKKGGRSELKELHVEGNALARSESLEKPRPSPLKIGGPPIKTTTLRGDDLRITFVTDSQRQPEPRQLFAAGHTVLQQDAPLGEQETSSGDTLTGLFAEADSAARTNASAGLVLASAVQTGNVMVRRDAAMTPGAPKQRVANATAQRAAYDGATQKVTLTGDAHVTQDNASLNAATIVLDQRTQDADATGSILATLQGAQNPGDKPQPLTHVQSNTAHLNHETRQSEFKGTVAEPAKLWQEGSQVQAAVLQFDDVRRTFAARGATSSERVHAVFAGTSAQPSNTKGAQRGNVIRVACQRMDYSDTLRQAVFSGSDGVEIEGSPGRIRGQRAVAYLIAAPSKDASPRASASATPSPFNGSLDRVVINGDVQLDQPGRHGSGEQLVYTAATGNSVLTGTSARPPNIVDAQQGSITGSSLLFGDAGSTIVVSGTTADPQHAGSKPGRVHTETEIQSGKETRQ